jgi:hypothetical protein
MSVRRLDDGNYLVRTRNDKNISGYRERTIHKDEYDEIVLHHETTRVIDRVWPKSIETWRRESPTCFSSSAPDGRVAVILKNNWGLWCAKWRVKGEKDKYISQSGVEYSENELVEMFAIDFAKDKSIVKLACINKTC